MVCLLLSVGCHEPAPTSTAASPAADSGRGTVGDAGADLGLDNDLEPPHDDGGGVSDGPDSARLDAGAADDGGDLATCEPQPEACDGIDNDCDGRTDEPPLRDDPLHCGGCGRSCVVPDGHAICLDGECRIAACPEGLADVNHLAADGCEAACVEAGEERCDGIDNDCDGRVDDRDPGDGSACAVAGAPGQRVCLGGSMVCRTLGPPAELCGEASGRLTPGAQPYRLVCAVAVPRDGELVAEAGVTLESGPYPLRVYGRALLRGVALRRVEATGLEVASGGRLRLEDTSLIRAGVSEAPLVSVRGGEASLLRVALRDADGHARGVHATQGGHVDALDTTFAGLWVGAQAGPGTALSVDGCRFLSCGTSLLAEEDASLQLRRSAFVGESFHLWAEPDAVAGAAVQWGTVTFAGGWPVTLAGRLDGDLEIGDEEGRLGALRLLGVHVGPDATLRVGPRLRVWLSGLPLVVEGRVSLQEATLLELQGTALRLLEGSTGWVRGSRLEAGARFDGPLIELAGARCEVEDTVLAGFDGRAVGLVTLPAAVDAGLRITGSYLEGLREGLAVQGPTAVEVSASHFLDCALGVRVTYPARLALSECLFVGPGRHLSMTPAALQGVDPPWLADNAFEEGTPLHLEGAVRASTRLVSLQPGLSWSLGRLRVEAGGQLSSSPGLRMDLLDGPLEVAGDLQLNGVLLSAGVDTALDFLPGATGTMEAVTVALHQAAEVPLVRIRGSSPELLRVVLDGAGELATGVDVAGAGDVVAAPRLEQCRLSRLRVGVAVGPGAEPTFEATTFDAVLAPRCPGDPACP